MPLPLVGAHAVLEGVPQFTKDADTVNNKVGAIHKTFGGLGGIAQGAGNAVAGGLKTMALAGVGAVTGIGAVGGAILKLGYDASSLPGIESVFRNMTSSMSVDADALMGKMREASYGAVKDFDLMKSANMAMVGAGKEFGKEFAENLPALMKVSREAAKASGQSVDYMYNSIVTGIKRMSPMILDNLGFQISLGDAQQKYADKVGKTTAELSKEEKQIALLNEVTRLGNQLVEESGGHIDSVQKDVVAWGTALANVKDRIGIELVPILQKFMEIIGKPGQGMQDAIVKVAHGFVEWLLPAIDKVVLAISALTGGPLALLIKGLSNIGLGGLQTIGESLAGIFSGENINFFDLKNTISKALAPMLGKDMAEQFGNKAVDLAASIQAGLAPIRNWVNDNLLPVFNSIGGVIQGISDTLQGGDFPWEDVLPPDLANIAYNLVGSLSAIWDALKKGFAGDWSGAGEQLKAAVSQMINDAFGPGTGDAVVGFVANLIQGFNDALPAVLEFIGVLQQAFIDNLPAIMGVVDQLGILITNVFNTVLTVAQEVWPIVQTIMTTVWGVISSTLTTFYTQIFPLLLAAFQTGLEWVNANWPAIQAIIVTVITAIGDVITAVLGVVGPFMISTFQGIADWVTANWPYIQETIVIVMNAILYAVQTALQGIADFWSTYGALITDVATAVWETIKVVVTSAIAIIQDIIMIVMAAIHGDWKRVWELIVDILRRIWDVIKSIIDLALTIVKDLLLAAWTKITSDINETWEAIAKFFSDTWDKIKTTFNNNMADLKKGMEDWLINLKKTWEDAWNGIKKIVEDVWEGIKQAVADGINGVIEIINKFIRAANKVISHVPGASQIDELDPIRLAQGGILNKPVFVAGEAGSEVVAPLEGLLEMMRSSLSVVISDLAYNAQVPYSGPQPSNTYNYGNNTYVHEYNLTTQSVNRPGTLAMEFKAMEMSHL